MTNEPECDYMIDRDGDFWVRRYTSGDWVVAPDLEMARQRAGDEGELGSSFAEALREFGPLRPMREVVKTEVVELPSIRSAA